MHAYQPPFQLTHRMTTLVADIAERLGAWKAANRGALVPELRRGNRIRTLQAHALLMAGLVDRPGRLREGDVGIWRGKKLLHMAPPASQVPRLVKDLLAWLRATDAHPLVASAAFHYEFEFIHPFGDGNGRMGRLWQTLILSRWQPMLAWLPVETVVRNRQQDYYAQLARADAASDCSGFIEFMLQVVADSLDEAIAVPLRRGARTESGVRTPNPMRSL